LALLSSAGVAPWIKSNSKPFARADFLLPFACNVFDGPISSFALPCLIAWCFPDRSTR
jgi:hypothetical protein